MAEKKKDLFEFGKEKLMGLANLGFVKKWWSGIKRPEMTMPDAEGKTTPLDAATANRNAEGKRAYSCLMRAVPPLFLWAIPGIGPFIAVALAIAPAIGAFDAGIRGVKNALTHREVSKLDKLNSEHTKYIEECEKAKNASADPLEIAQEEVRIKWAQEEIKENNIDAMKAVLGEDGYRQQTKAQSDATQANDLADKLQAMQQEFPTDIGRMNDDWLKMAEQLEGIDPLASWLDGFQRQLDTESNLLKNLMENPNPDLAAAGAWTNDGRYSISKQEIEDIRNAKHPTPGVDDFFKANYGATFGEITAAHIENLLLEQDIHEDKIVNQLEELSKSVKDSVRGELPKTPQGKQALLLEKTVERISEKLETDDKLPASTRNDLIGKIDLLNDERKFYDQIAKDQNKLNTMRETLAEKRQSGRFTDQDLQPTVDNINKLQKDIKEAQKWHFRNDEVVEAVKMFSPDLEQKLFRPKAQQATQPPVMGA